MRRAKYWLSQTKHCKCGKLVLARGMCPTHYCIWRRANVEGARERYLDQQRRYAKKRRDEGRASSKSPDAIRHAYVSYMAKVPDWYIARSSCLPRGSPPELLEFARERLFLKRKLKERL